MAKKPKRKAYSIGGGPAKGKKKGKAGKKAKKAVGKGRKGKGGKAGGHNKEA